MIPNFAEQGYLPPGLHLATIEEIEMRFGLESELRRVQFESLRWLVEVSKKAGVLRIVINGSYVTNVHEPNDVDCVLLIDEVYPLNESAAAELEAGGPFLSIQLVSEPVFQEFVENILATDRNRIPKGLIEVVK